jgi:hypothetical protein
METELDMMTGYPKSRAAAREAGEMYFASGRSCVHGHRNPLRSTARGECQECNRLRAAKTYYHSTFSDEMNPNLFETEERHDS